MGTNHSTDDTVGFIISLYGFHDHGASGQPYQASVLQAVAGSLLPKLSL